MQKHYCRAAGTGGVFSLFALGSPVPVLTSTEAVVPTRSATSFGTSSRCTRTDRLGQADPIEGRTDAGKQVLAGTAALLDDAPADAVHDTAERGFRVAHQRDHRLVPRFDPPDQGLAEESVAAGWRPPGFPDVG